MLLIDKTFTFQDQQNFAEFSGDYNPIHVDAIASRRTIAGECIVHGVHGVMVALEAYIKLIPKHFVGLSAEFLSPIFLNHPVECVLDQEQSQILMYSQEKLKTRIKLLVGEQAFIRSNSLKILPAKLQPDDISFLTCLSKTKTNFGFCGETNQANKLFPSLVGIYGLSLACEMSALSELVGNPPG